MNAPLRFPLPAAGPDQVGTLYDLGGGLGLAVTAVAPGCVEVCPVQFDVPQLGPEHAPGDVLVTGAASPFAQPWNERAGAFLLRLGQARQVSRESLAALPLAAHVAANLSGLQPCRTSRVSAPPR